MITYAKGASVLHQLVIWLGWDTFVKGTNVYLTRHRFGNAELADYLEALDSVTDRDVRGWAESYLRTTGFDTIRRDARRRRTGAGARGLAPPPLQRRGPARAPTSPAHGWSTSSRSPCRCRSSPAGP